MGFTKEIIVNKNKYLFRPFEADDSISELTLLLNNAYKILEDMGFNYTAAYQDENVTFRRINKGTCYIIKRENELIATITYSNTFQARGCSWYNKENVAKINQFAVHPKFQKIGLGSKILEIMEDIAKQDGAKELALDTAEGVDYLIEYNKKRGYRFIEFAQWEGKNYRTVILSKNLIE